MKDIKNFLHSSPTAYHAVNNVRKLLEENNFTQLVESESWSIKKGGSYYVIKDGSALIAFKVGEDVSTLGIVASHTDSPALKIKLNPIIKQNGYVKLNVERYGGGLNYSWLDIPLRIAGRIIVKNSENALVSRLVHDERLFVIPSVAVHFNREVNSKGLVLNAQTDLQPIISQNLELDLSKVLHSGEEILDYDLYLTCAIEPFYAGVEEEFFCAPRIDNLTSVFASIEALVASQPKGIAMAFLADNEEVGSATKQGAGSTFLRRTVSRISKAFDMDKDILHANSFMVSSDNAHAIHPNHGELNDPTNKVLLNGGVVIKHHANQNYTTDAFSSAFIKTLAKENDVPVQDFFMRSDLPCGGTLGAISSSQLSIRSVDIGLPQLAMHSTIETMGSKDYANIVKLLTSFYNTKVFCPSYDVIKYN